MEKKTFVRDVLIRCPQCGWRQLAQAYWYEGDPFPTYSHTCSKCEHEIIESEWEEI